MPNQNRDADVHKGAVEQDARDQQTNTSLAGHLPHRKKPAVMDSKDSDFPEPGENPEHTGQTGGSQVNPEGATQNQDPGHRQKQNQNREKDDPLAA